MPKALCCMDEKITWGLFTDERPKFWLMKQMWGQKPIDVPNSHWLVNNNRLVLKKPLYITTGFYDDRWYTSSRPLYFYQKDMIGYTSWFHGDYGQLQGGTSRNLGVLRAAQTAQHEWYPSEFTRVSWISPVTFFFKSPLTIPKNQPSTIVCENHIPIFNPFV